MFFRWEAVFEKGGRAFLAAARFRGIGEWGIQGILKLPLSWVRGVKEEKGKKEKGAVRVSMGADGKGFCIRNSVPRSNCRWL